MDTEPKKRFPLRAAYAFAAENGLSWLADEIRDMEIEWDRSYISSVRSGRMLREFEARKLLPAFIIAFWPYGGTVGGERERLRFLRIAQEYDAFLQGRDLDEEQTEAAEASSLEFALEAHMRDFLVKNLAHLETGLKLYEANGRRGAEFPIDGGRIDILAVDKAGKFVVVELKLSQGRNKVLGQLLYYMGWIDRNLGNGPCRGIVIAREISEELVVAVARVPGISLARYRMQFSIEKIA